MPIRVTCPGCHTRFDVSEKYAGKSGPCPKCKKVIIIPEEEVVIHAPVAGPKDAEGRPVLKPIAREHANLSQVQIALIVVSVVGFFLLALVMRMMIEDKSKFPNYLIWIAAVAVAPPVVYGAYTFLRDQELGSFLGKELWGRVAACSAAYAALWFLMPVMKYGFDGYELGSWIVALVGMFAAGAAMAMLLLDLDYLMGLVHAGMYYGVCLLGRLIVGVGVLPGMLENSVPVEEKKLPGSAQLLDAIQTWFC